MELREDLWYYWRHSCFANVFLKVSCVFVQVVFEFTEVVQDVCDVFFAFVVFDRKYHSLFLSVCLPWLSV